MRPRRELARFVAREVGLAESLRRREDDVDVGSEDRARQGAHPGRRWRPREDLDGELAPFGAPAAEGLMAPGTVPAR